MCKIETHECDTKNILAEFNKINENTNMCALLIILLDINRSERNLT